jgi:hypothetical protein
MSSCFICTIWIHICVGRSLVRQPITQLTLDLIDRDRFGYALFSEDLSDMTYNDRGVLLNIVAKF